jgi:hypothetical protein
VRRVERRVQDEVGAACVDTTARHATHCAGAQRCAALVQSLTHESWAIMSGALAHRPSMVIGGAQTRVWF